MSYEWNEENFFYQNFRNGKVYCVILIFSISQIDLYRKSSIYSEFDILQVGWVEAVSSWDQA